MRSRIGAVAAVAALTFLSTPAAHADPSPSPSPSPSASPSLPPTPVTAYDLVAIGATARGRVGSIVQITVGMKNLGPAASQGSAGAQGPKHTILVGPPPGTEFVVDPSDPPCADLNARPPTAHQASCILFSLDPGETTLITFDVRIVGAVTGQGRVTRSFFLGIDRDTNRDNDTAAITITTEELPRTGTDTTMIAAIGSGAVVLGGLLLLVLRRHGTRRN